MCSLPQISEAEYEVMKIIWNHAPINTNEITAYLLETTTWNPKTIHTLIKRLVDKGAITYEKQGRIFVYTPAIKEVDYVSQKSDSFLNRFYHGDITAMLTAYVDTGKLTESEIDTLRAILSRDSGKRRG